VLHALTLLVCYALFKGLMRLALFRREMRKFVRLSKQGPLYRLGAWLLAATMRRVLGKRAYVEPTLAPRAAQLKRTTDSIALTWRCRQKSRWATDALEVAARDESNPVAVEVDGWTATARGLQPGARYQFRARSRNPLGCSPWSREVAVATHQRPVDGGGRGPHYVWRQTPRAVQIVVCDLPDGTRGRDVKLDVASHSLSLAVRDLLIFDKVPLYKAIVPDEALWDLLDDPRRLVLTVDKLHPTLRNDHWPCLVKGHPTIDTTLLADLPLSPDFPA